MKFNFIHTPQFWLKLTVIMIFVVLPSSVFSLKHVIIPAISEPVNPIRYPGVFELDQEDKQWIEKTLTQMSLREKIAQMIMPWAYGNELTEGSSEYERLYRLSKYTKVGGFIFFQGDIKNTARNINFLQSGSEIPLLITADFERGLGYRLKDATEFPSQMSVAATGNLTFAYKMGKVIARESRAIGVHQNFAPVADINDNPFNPIINNRAYSDDKDIVARFGASFIMGSKEERMLTTAKHFPGHGNTSSDSHIELPTIPVSRFNLANNELVPFLHMINSGVQSVMVGHLYVPAIEAGNKIPSSLSKKIVTDLLQEEMGFEGLVVTDAMNMNAITNHYSVGEAAVLAVKAGNDIILMPPDEELAINSIYFAVEAGDISEERINRSVRKILSAKRWLKLNNGKLTDESSIGKFVGTKSNLRLADEIAAASVTLVKNKNGILPIDPDKYYSIASITINDANGNKRGTSFQSMIDSNLGYVNSLYLNRKSKDNDFKRALNTARQSGLVILSIYLDLNEKADTGKKSKPIYNFLTELSGIDKPVVLIGMDNPYIISAFPDAGAYICAFGDVVATRRAVVNSLLGKSVISGTLPVSLYGTSFRIGEGLKYRPQTLNFTSVEEDPLFDFDDINNLIREGVEQKIFPGGTLLIGYKGRVIYNKAFGNFTYESSATPVMKEAIFDLASITKVAATTTAAMILYDEGKLDPDQRVDYYLPGFSRYGKENITVRNLLLHNAGFVSSRQYKDYETDKKGITESIYNERLQSEPGQKTLYSDLGMIALQLIIEKISGLPLDDFVKKNVFDPLKMKRTMFNPGKEYWYYCPPTSNAFDPVKRNKGVVHDYNAFIMGGVSGHAGLFSTTSDLAVFCQMLLQEGNYNGRQIIKSSTVKEWTRKQGEGMRALGWDVISIEGSAAGKLFSETSFGHTGYTGTSIWIDPSRELFVVFLTNRTYPDGSNGGIISFRPKLHDSVVRTVDF